MKTNANFIKQTFFVLAILSTSIATFGQSTGNEILGTWWNQEKDSKIEIFKDGNTYSGKIIWIKIPNDPETGKPLLDKKNPDENLRANPILGSVLMHGFTYDKSENEWSGGTIYDAIKGKTYNCYIKLHENGMIKVRGYIGAAWMGLGRTTIWTKAN